MSDLHCNEGRIKTVVTVASEHCHGGLDTLTRVIEIDCDTQVPQFHNLTCFLVIIKKIF